MRLGLVPLVVAFGLGAGGAGGCLFQPNLAAHGYVACDDGGGCPAGRSCVEGICSPPTWQNDTYARRQLLTVTNADPDDALPAGGAVPLVIGEGGLLSIEEVGADAVFLAYDDATTPSLDDPTAGWSTQPVHRLILPDRLIVWIPAPTTVLPGRTEALTWIHTEHVTGETLVLEDPSAVFERFDDFATVSLGLDENRYRIAGTGDADLEDGRITVRDNQQLFGLERVSPPFALTFTGRIVGLLCDALFLGVVADDNIGSEPPYAGFFFDEGLTAALDVVSTATSAPEPTTPTEVDRPTALHRYTVEVHTGRVSLSIDDQPFQSRDDLVPPFSGEDLVPTVDVDGDDCTFELEGLWLTSGPFVPPTVAFEPAVERSLEE